MTYNQNYKIDIYPGELKSSLINTVGTSDTTGKQDTEHQINIKADYSIKRGSFVTVNYVRQQNQKPLHKSKKTKNMPR